MPNIITFVRILCSIALLFVPAFKPAFYALYILAGVSDMLDGMIARKTNTVSDFGSKLDTVADMVLVAVCLIKMLPMLDIPLWLYIWIAVIALMKVINIISGFVMQKKFVAAHTVMNKVTGVLLFLLPLSVSFIDVRYSGGAVCAVASFAAIQEGHFIRTGDRNQKGSNL
ncbi:MAG: CDP-alcohol phosphatidyltransferase family protein [Clostridia bacterium]|nr:CDP-alcohol phosphatidyltransferase family protein [Clostridia bacterium]